ncbi:transposase [Nocardia takedensis]
MAAPKKYPDELKARAVRLYRDSDPKPTIRKLAAQLGVHHEALRNWIRQDQATPGNDTTVRRPMWWPRTRSYASGSPNSSVSMRCCVMRVRISPRSSARPGGDRAVRESASAAPGRARIAGVGDRVLDVLRVAGPGA